MSDKPKRPKKANREPHPYRKWDLSARPSPRHKVGNHPIAQRKARELIASHGCCVYENPDGLIRDLGVPLKEKHRGKVFKAKPKPPAAPDQKETT